MTSSEPVVAPVPVRRVEPVELPADRLAHRREHGESFPIIDRDACTFAFCGPAIRVRMVHFGVGLPDDLDFTPVSTDGPEDWWVLALSFPAGSRFEYKLEITDSFGTHLVEDPLNPLVARHPFGGNSVCEAAGYVDPDWASQRPDVAAGSIVDVEITSAALGRRADATVYRPAGFDSQDGRRYPLVVLHDGGDYLRYAGLSSVLDNLIDGGAIPATIVALLHPVERLVEYADDRRHHAYLVDELLPRLEADLPLTGERYLSGASFGAVATLSAAVFAPGVFTGLLLQSGSFAGAGTGCWRRPEPLWTPVKEFVGRYLAAPAAVVERVAITCGLFESLICENRGLAPVLEGSGMRVSFDQWLDGHNWTSWRNSLGVALPRLMASA